MAGAPGSVVPQVGDGGPAVGGGLGSKQLPGLLSVSLLQIIPLVHVASLEGRGLFALLLQERLQLQLLLLFKLPTLIVLEFLHGFFLFLVNNLKSTSHENWFQQSDILTKKCYPQFHESKVNIEINIEQIDIELDIFKTAYSSDMK